MKRLQKISVCITLVFLLLPNYVSSLAKISVYRAQKIGLAVVAVSSAGGALIFANKAKNEIKVYGLHDRTRYDFPLGLSLAAWGVAAVSATFAYKYHQLQKVAQEKAASKKGTEQSPFTKS